MASSLPAGVNPGKKPQDRVMLPVLQGNIASPAFIISYEKVLLA
jgi:hypothetical protein